MMTTTKALILVVFKDAGAFWEEPYWTYGDDQNVPRTPKTARSDALAAWRSEKSRLRGV